MKQLKKDLQKGIKEIRTQFGLNSDQLRVSFTEKQQAKGEFTISTCEKVLNNHGEAIITFCEKYGSLVDTEDGGTFAWSRRLRFKLK